MEFIYADYNATTPIDDKVQKHIIESLKCHWANSSSGYHLGVEAKSAIEQARREVAQAINAQTEDIIFTSGGTESSNMAIQSAVKLFLKKSSKDKVHIITTNVEHVATLNPLKQLKEENKAEVTYVPVDQNGYLSSHDIIKAIEDNTCLITIMLANNETGVIFPISDIARELEKMNEMRRVKGLQKVLFHSDAAQAIGKILVDVKDLGIDYLTIAGHKFYGPKVGALYVKGIGGSTAAPIQPVIYGGGQERGFRPGTENTPMIVGLGKAAALVNENIGVYKNHLQQIRDYFENKLSDECDITINCKSSPRLPNTSNISFCINGKETDFSGAKLLETCKRIIASTTAACHSHTEEPSEVLLASGVPRNLATTAVRFSFGRETTRACIDIIIKDLTTAINTLMTNNK
ncbi:selenocysteine lyase isoform X2 [Nilaparvata lugens]|nr:selenocysteine lyase isoform X2 [Nilaparvata lugens]XP_039287192.1 selenocysteine lyase isoform X2 [Nilaparvata lugens]XP_039287210.1 selenocysteine lyase isoform X2 [Nilaparvata lugens]